MSVTGWVWTENFRPYLRYLAGLVGHELTVAEMTAIESTLDGSDAEHGHWCVYSPSGRPEIALTMAYEVGYDNVQVQFEGEEAVGLKAEAAMEVMRSYSLRERRA